MSLIPETINININCAATEQRFTVIMNELEFIKTVLAEHTVKLDTIIALLTKPEIVFTFGKPVDKEI